MSRSMPKLIFSCIALLFIVPAISLSIEDNKAVVSGTGVELKSRPYPRADTIVTIKEGEAIMLINRLEAPDEIDGVIDNWYFIRYRGLEGWVFGAHIDTEMNDTEKPYSEVEPFLQRIDEMYDLKKQGSLEEAAELSTEVIEDIEENFSIKQIMESKRLSAIILISLSMKGECLTYLGKSNEASETFDYLMVHYPWAKLESESIPASEIIEPFMVLIEHYPEDNITDNPQEPVEKLKDALIKKDIFSISELALPGIFEIWVAHTDWVVKLGVKNLIDQTWLVEAWTNNWEIRLVDTIVDDNHEIVGYCIETGPWEINYYGRPVNQIDFCVDMLPGGGFAFSYMVLHTTPDR